MEALLVQAEQLTSRSMDNVDTDLAHEVVPEPQDSHKRRRADTMQHPQGSGFEGAERFIGPEYRQTVSDSDL